MSGFTNMSDPRIRKSIYKYMTAGKLNLCSFKGRQSGGGIAGMYSKKPFKIPVNPHTTKEKTNEIHVFSSRQVVGKQVTPMAVERAKKKKLKEDMREKYSTCSGKQYKSGEQSVISQISVSQEEKATKIPSNNTYRKQKIDSVML